MKNSISMLILCSFLSPIGCTATVGTSAGWSVPVDARQTCETYCHDVGMELGAVAIMANNVGCICESGGKAGQTTASAVSAGMAALVLQMQTRQQQQQQHQQSTTYH